VVVVGGANMDIAAQVPGRIAPGDSNPGAIQCSPGGVARNVAENLARLGANPYLISAVGDDLFGRTLVDATRNVGVCVDGVHISGSHCTATYLSVHGDDGDMAVAVNDMSIIETLSPQMLDAYINLAREPDYLVLDCNLSEAALSGLLPSPNTPAHSVRRPFVFVDAVSAAKCERIAPFLAGVHLLKINRLEAQALSGLPVSSASEAQTAAAFLHAQGVEHVVVSMGAQGVCWCDAQGHTGVRAATTVNVVNTAGAGDALLAGLVFGTMQQWTLERCIAFAMACAELTLASPHANAPDLSLRSIESHLAAR
jgi:pseudouridine kinase